MIAAIIFLNHGSAENLSSILIPSAACFLILAVWVQWDSKYRRRWQQRQAREWQRTDGRFDEGEVVTMRKGRSEDIAGYEVWLGYEYQQDGEQAGLFTLPITKDQDEAKQLLAKLANRPIIVHVAPGRSDRSRVLDEDVEPLLGRPVCSK